MEANAASALPATVGGDGDVDGTIERAQQPPVDSGRSVAQHGIGTTGEDGRHPTRLFAEPHMPHGVDPLM